MTDETLATIDTLLESVLEETDDPDKSFELPTSKVVGFSVDSRSGLS